MQRLVVIRGAPASGKSTIAKAMRDLSSKVVWLKVDAFKDFFSDDPTAALDQVNDTAIATLDALLEQGYSVVLEGVFQNTRYIGEAAGLAGAAGIPVRVFQTQCSLEVLKERDLSRPGVKEGVRQPLADDLLKYLHELQRVSAYPGSLLLDTEHYSVEECVKAINAQFTEE